MTDPGHAGWLIVGGVVLALFFLLMGIAGFYYSEDIIEREDEDDY